MTLLLGGVEIGRLLDVDEVLRDLRDGFCGQSPVAPARVRAELPGGNSATGLLAGTAAGIPAYTAKVNAKFPGVRPALRGLVCLHDLTDGSLLAVLDSAAVTSWRTGLAAAVVSAELAGPPGTVGVVGAGAQASRVVAGLRRLGWGEELVVHDLDPGRAAAFCPGARVVGSAREVAAAADLVVLATWSREPLLDLADVRAGSHLTSLGVDEPGKHELGAALLSAATLVVDDVPQAFRGGAPGNAGLGAEAVDATAAEVLTGTHPGRTGAAEITAYTPTGMPWQDLVLAWSLYRSARERGVGAEFDFLHG